MIKRFAALLSAVLLLSACSVGPAYPRTPKEERTPLPDICMEDTFFNGSIMEAFYRESYSLDDRWDDEGLQNAVASVKLDYPIDTLDEINHFSWELYDIALAAEIMPPEMKPHSAKRYAEGIWQFTFNPKTGFRGYYDGDEVNFLVSGEDGHIITLRTETMFLEPFGPTFYPMYNGSDDLAPGQRAALKSISWLEYGYNEHYFVDEAHSADEWFDHQQWQSIATGIDAAYPLIEGAQIIDWAWAVYDKATEEDLMVPLLVPSHALHFNDGIWVLIFQENLSNDGENNVTRSVLISDSDGHVIHID